MQRISWLSILGMLIALAGIAQGFDINTSQLDSLKQQFLPPEFRGKNFTLDEVSKIFGEKCRKVSGVKNATLIKDIEQSLYTMTKCVTNLFNTSSMQDEIEKARPTGELDTVFHNYCTKTPQAEKCLHTFNEKLQPCLTSKEREQNKKLLGVITKFLSYMCAKGGDQLALFVAEEGPECFEANKEAISHCANKSFAEYVPKNNEVPDLFNLPELVLEPKHCTDMEHFESCVLHYLQQCRELTPANVAESVFRLIKNETSCKSLMQAKANERSILRTTGSGVAPLSLAAFGVTFSLILVSLSNRLRS